MVELLVLPTKPRNKTEEVLLDEIATDTSLENPKLMGKVIEYINIKLSLVAWFHPSAAITKYSFEDAELAKETHDSYNGEYPIPRIVGILAPSSM